jgi:triacylglycerol lipase
MHNSARHDYTVLLHGLGSTSESMRALGSSLSSLGFRVVNIDYPSTKHPIELLAEHVGNVIRRRCTKEKKIHFVPHSLGGIVLRYYLKQNPLGKLGRVVMLSPPNQGNQLADRLRDSFLLRVAAGPSGRQLGTDLSSVPVALGPVDFEVCIIAGNRSLNPVLSHLIPGADDGRVAVERTKVEGMADLIAVPRAQVGPH